MIRKLLGIVLCLIYATTARQCPDGASEYAAGNQCLLGFDAAATFDAAEKACALGGQLVQPQNRLHNMIAAAQIQQAISVPNAFIGVLKVNGTWRYADGTSLTYQNWKSANEQNKPGALCVLLNGKDFYWYSVSCSEWNPFVCSVEDNSYICPVDWSYNPTTGACYYTPRAVYWPARPSITFSTGEAFCMGAGGHLVSIHDIAEFSYVANMVITPAYSNYSSVGGTYWYLIGLSHGNWTDGTPLDYGRFQTSVDKNASTHSLHMDDENSYFYPGNATTPYESYVCKQPANTVGSTRKKMISTAAKKMRSVKTERGLERYCPYDSINYSDLHECVVGVNAGATYETAVRICALGGRLIQPMSSDENMLAVLQNAAELGGQATYIGVERIDGTWHYADGTELKYQNWKNPDEINNPDHGCVVLNSSDFYWYSADCLGKRAFICSTPDQTRVCLPGWTYFPTTGYCYYTQMAMIWKPPPILRFETAEAACANEGSHLVSIHSDEENQFVADLLSSAMSTYHHDCDMRLQTVIGLSHSKWTDGSAFDYNTGLGMAESYGMSDPACKSTSWSGWNATQVYANYVCKKKAHMLTSF